MVHGLIGINGVIAIFKQEKKKDKGHVQTQSQSMEENLVQEMTKSKNPVQVVFTSD